MDPVPEMMTMRDVADAGPQRDQRVVDDENPGFVADAAHDAAHDVLVRRAIDARDTRQMADGHDARSLERLLHYRVHHLLQRQLTDALQIRALFATLRDDAAS
jgi:hypothetical protein